MSGGDSGVRRLRLDSDVLETVLNRMDEASSMADRRCVARGRRSVRWAFRSRAAVLMLGDAHGVWRAFAVVTRNLSTGGIGVLRDGYVHVGTPCMVGLRSLTGMVRTMHGRVVRCRHVAGTAHEIGVAFDEALDPGMFVRLPDVTTVHTDHVDEGALAGRVMVVESELADVASLRRCVSGTGVELEFFDSAEEALRCSLEGFDLAWLGVQVKGVRGPDAIASLRDGGLCCPVIVMTGEGGEDVPARCARAGAELLVRKPLEKQRVLRAMAEFLSPGSARGVAIEADVEGCSLLLDPERFRLALGEVREKGGEIDTLLRGRDWGGLRELALSLRSVSGEIGLTVVEWLAGDVLALLERGSPDERMLREFVRRLGRACGRVREAA